MGEVVEVSSAHTEFCKGERIVVSFNINCGECRQCKLGNYSVCQRSNRNAAKAAEQFGYTTAGLFGYSHLMGGYSGGQAEYDRVPMADVGPMKVPDEMTERKRFSSATSFRQATKQPASMAITQLWARESTDKLPAATGSQELPALALAFTEVPTTAMAPLALPMTPSAPALRDPPPTPQV